MDDKNELNKVQENILGETKISINTNQFYCDNQDICKIVKLISNQYNEVVKQNQSLQSCILWQKEQMEKDGQYLIELEEKNILLERDVETLKRQTERQHSQNSKLLEKTNV